MRRKDDFLHRSLRCSSAANFLDVVENKKNEHHMQNRMHSKLLPAFIRVTLCQFLIIFFLLSINRFFFGSNTRDRVKRSWLHGIRLGSADLCESVGAQRGFVWKNKLFVKYTVTSVDYLKLKSHYFVCSWCYWHVSTQTVLCGPLNEY